MAAYLVLVASGHPDAAWEGVLEGPRRLASETLPLSGVAALLSPLLILGWVSTWVTTSLLLAPRGAGARVGLAVPVLALGAALAVGTGAPSTWRGSGGSLLVILSVTALVSRGPLPPRALAAGLAAAGAVTLVASGAAARLLPAGDNAGTVRRAVSTSPRQLADPLDAMASLRNSPDAARKLLLTARLGATSTGYLSMATLDTYDGGSWTFDATFLPTGGRIPGPGPGALSARPPVVQRITVQGPLPLPMLPVLGRPTGLDGLRVLYEPVSAMVVPAGTAAPPVAYGAVSGPAATLAELSPGDLVDHPAAASQDMELPADSTGAVDAVIRYLASITGTRPAASIPFLREAVEVVRDTDRRVDPQSEELARVGPGATPAPAVADLGGTSLAQVINAVTVDRAATPEQFATFIAVAARGLGIPARVVTGFRLPTSSEGRPLAPGVYQVTSNDAWTWVEVPVVGLGWVVVDPTPDAGTSVTAPPPVPAQPAVKTLPPRGADALGRPGLSGAHPLARPVRPLGPRRGTSGGLPPLLVAALATAFLALATTLSLQAAVRRRRRRRARQVGSASERAVGAWLELLEGLSRAGMRVDAACTSSELAEAAGGCFGSNLTAPVARVGALADAALFGPRALVLDDRVHAAWDEQARAVNWAFATLDRRQRLSAALLVGPVGGARRPRRRTGFRFPRRR
jgi:hypothetical protein